MAKLRLQGSFRVALGGILPVLLLAGQAFSAEIRSLQDLTSAGPPVGSSMPSFELKDHSGNMRTLRSLMGSRGLVLVFFRSADW